MNQGQKWEIFMTGSSKAVYTYRIGGWLTRRLSKLLHLNSIESVEVRYTSFGRVRNYRVDFRVDNHSWKWTKLP